MSSHQAFPELRALAALEVEVARMLAEKVSQAIKTGMTWGQVAEAIGVARPTAWRRWEKVVEDPRLVPNPLRRDTTRLKLNDEAKEAVVELLTGTLIDRLIKSERTTPYATGVRHILNQRHLRFSVRVFNQEARFQLLDYDLVLSAAELSNEDGGGVVATLLPTALDSLHGGAKPQIDRYTITDDGSLCMDQARLEKELDDFIEKQLRIAIRHQ